MRVTKTPGETPAEKQRPMDEAHKRAHIYAASLVSATLETHDRTVRDPLTAMARRMIENTMGIRERRDGLSQEFAFVYESILQAPREEKLDRAAMHMLGRLAIQEPEQIEFTVEDATVSTTTYRLHPRFGAMQVERVAASDEPNVHFILHSLDVVARDKE